MVTSSHVHGTHLFRDILLLQGQAGTWEGMLEKIWGIIELNVYTESPKDAEPANRGCGKLPQYSTCQT